MLFRMEKQNFIAVLEFNASTGICEIITRTYAKHKFSLVYFMSYRCYNCLRWLFSYIEKKKGDDNYGTFNRYYI